MLEFHDPGRLIDDDFELILVEKYPGDLTINYVPAYRFIMTLVSRGKEIGQFEFRVGNTHHLIMYGGHLAYFVHPEYRGHQYAAKACKLVLPLARSHGFQTLWITCNPDNIASRRTCELVGAKLAEIVDLPANTDMFQEGERQKCRYRLDF